MNCAYSNNGQLQLMALTSLLTKYQKDGSLDKEFLQIPIDLAQEGLLFENNKNLDVQLKAISILGEIGGQEALNSLSNILISSKDAKILIEAVHASSQITAEDYKYFINALGTVMKQQHSQFKDNEFAFVSLTAIDNMTQKAGNILTSEILGIMMIYSEGEYNQKVKEYSRNLLNLILTKR
ncbi:MAG: hypothetical protein PF518_08910 [Spirochaetaceae bacterium]|nr:hypothetical protein [Spirochaetaceae bacterium]